MTRRARRKVVAQRDLIVVDFRLKLFRGAMLSAEDSIAMFAGRGEQVVERLLEQIDAFDLQLVANFEQVDARGLQLVDRVTRLVEVRLEGRGRLAVIAERIHRRRRHRVDGIGTDQLIDVFHVAVSFVLGAGRRP